MSVVAIYGACGLIGKTLVNNFMQDGFDVVSCDINIEEGIAENEKGVRNRKIKVDLNNTNEVKKSIKIINEISKSDIKIINCTYPRGASYGKSFYELELNEFNETIKMHLGAYFNLMREAVIHSKKENCSVTFVNFASVYGVIPPRFQIYADTEMVNPIEYGAVKSSIIHMTKYVAKLMKGYSFKINSISPGGILDGQDDVFLEKYKKYCVKKGMLESDDIYGTIKFLVSEQSTFMTGQNLVIDDGFSL